MDAEAWYCAIEGRDGRFAGRFFLGVHTTHIYCQPRCPARLPRRETTGNPERGGDAEIEVRLPLR
ncbi:MAG TPA: Ada metal-binding domain-containing protein [Myxococcales bacterium]